MKDLRDIPIRRKLALVVMFAAGVALLLAASAFTINELSTFRQAATRHIEALAEITAANTAPAVVFGDTRAVHETLGFLANQRHIEIASVTTDDGDVLGRYLRADLVPEQTAMSHPRDHEAHWLSGHIDVFQPILVDDRTVGEVYLRADLLEPLGERLATYGGIVVATMLLALLAAFAVGGILQKIVTQPLLGLAATAQRISREKHYDLRAEPAGRDEVGQLIGSFNVMLDEIQARDDQLLQHREHLKEMVALRTGELEALNTRLRQARDTAEQTAEKMSYQALHDALTGLPNRALLNNRLGIALANALRDDGRVALLFLDLDRFKVINDSLGHAVGDQLLAETARRLKSCVRREDTVARFGGDEFMVLLASIGEHDDATRVAEKIISTLAQPVLCQGHELFVTTSVGITVFPDDGAEGERLIRNADVAMYQAKEKGRNSFQFWTPDMEKISIRRLSLENRLRKAVDRQELELFYQPLFDLSGGRIYGVEALLRWNDDEQGLISPAQFIPLAEETGLIIPIGEWVMAEACRQIRDWHAVGHPELVMAVNLSACQFRRNHMPEMVIHALDSAGLAGSACELEITESVFMHGSQANRHTLEVLRDRGVRIAIDDFGTGYASLNYLRRFPVDSVKIDRSFVTRLPHDDGDASIATAIVAMAHSLRLDVVAEGVETTEQLAFLAELGCDRVQGYLYSPPVAADRLLGLLEDDAVQTTGMADRSTSR